MLPTIDVISLVQRPERLGRTVMRLQLLGLNYRWFPAVEGGWRGCRASHIVLWRRAVEADRVLAVMEDDVNFAEDFRAKLDRVLAELPDDWDLLFLGGYSSGEPRWAGKHVARVGSVMWTHAYLAKPAAVAYSLHAIEELDCPLDYAWAGRMAALRVYRAWPWLVGQEDGWSDVGHIWAHGRTVLDGDGPKTSAKEGTWPTLHGSD